MSFKEDIFTFLTNTLNKLEKIEDIMITQKEKIKILETKIEEYERQKDKLDMAFRIFIVIFTNLLYSLSIVIFIEPCKLFAGGASGLAQLIKRFLELFIGNVDLGLLILLVNIPIFLIGVKYVSKKFAIYSVIAVLIQSLSTSVFTKLFENNNQPYINTPGIYDFIFYTSNNSYYIGAFLHEF